MSDRDLSKIPLDELVVSARLYKLLTSWGILTVGDVAEMSSGQLLAIPNFGKKCLKELTEEIAVKYGITIPDPRKWCPHCGGRLKQVERV